MKLSFAVLLLTASVPLALAQGTYTQIDVPGSLGTECLSVDSAGDLIGEYIDSSDNWHGFLYSNGVVTNIDYPGASYTYPFGINDVGQIVGDADGLGIGFLYDVQAQTFQKVSDPQASITDALSINNSGAIAGSIEHGGYWQGFEAVGGRFNRIAPSNNPDTFVIGITSAGSVAGEAVKAVGVVGLFVYDNGKYTEISVPQVGTDVQLSGINPTGTAIVGYYYPSSGVTAGFLYERGSLTVLQFPGSSYSEAIGINDSGEVVGLFEDTEGNTHGFTWTPPAADEKK